MSKNKDERGASAILVAASLVLLLGMAAIGVDVGAGYNERRQDQTAADLAATSGAVYSANEAKAIPAALEVARSNLTTEYGDPTDPNDPAWIALWNACTDPDRPSGFFPVDDPWSADPAVKLQCMSVAPAHEGGPELRVKIPDQETDTTFGGILGLNQFVTRAIAHVGFRFVQDGEFVPFGLLYGAATGAEQCVVQPPGGLATGACVGPTSGNFGTMELPTWGNKDKGTTPNCNKADQALFAQNIAIGSDHIVLPATGSDGTPNSFPGTGGPHPGDGAIPGSLAKFDDCSLSSGQPLPTDLVPTFPLNTIDTNTGSSSDPIKLGLIGAPGSLDPVYPGGKDARLRRLDNPANYVDLREKNGSNQEAYQVDNTPLWYYLVDPGDLSGFSAAGVGGVCNKNYLNTLSWPANRTAFMACLAAYEAYRTSTPNPKPLFIDDLIKNPRFGWAPRFHYTDWGSGTSWQPVHSFVALYFDGLWFNCNGSGSGPNTDPCDNAKGVHFFPEEYGNTTILKSGAGPYGGQLRLDQMTALVIPTEALPKSIQDTYPGIERGPFSIQLVR